MRIKNRFFIQNFLLLLFLLLKFDTKCHENNKLFNLKHHRELNYTRKELNMWKQFKLENDKFYKDKKEEIKRFKIWMENYNYVISTNRNQIYSHKLDLNSFCDLTQQEISKYKHGLKLNAKQSLKSSAIVNLNNFLSLNNLNIKNTALLESSEDLPNRIDWFERGFVSPVKDQGICGACYSFVTTGILESYYRIKKNVKDTYSEQNLLDCTSTYGNDGCNGGLMSQAFDYIIENKGLNTDEIYKYLGFVEKCRYIKTNSTAKAIKYVSLPVDEGILKEALAKIGPIAAGIDADHRSFSLYKEGIYFEPKCSTENLNHAILIIGYGTEKNGEDYWLIKNSWGSKWGMNGFGKISRNKNNHCGIATLAGFPIIPD